MAKAMLILKKMPICCKECPLCQGVFSDGTFCCSIRDEEGEEQSYYEGDVDRPNYCPLRKVPSKKKNEDFTSLTRLGEVKGWNACIDEILGGGE